MLARQDGRDKLTGSLRESGPTANGTIGVLKVRVQELYADFIIRMLKAHFVITKGFGTEYTHQPAALYPASVIEAACIGTNLPMSYKKENFGIGKGEITFLCSPSASDLLAAELRGFWVKLDTYGEFHLSKIEVRMDTNTLFVAGMTGVGAAKLDLAPEMANDGSGGRQARPRARDG